MTATVDATVAVPAAREARGSLGRWLQWTLLAAPVVAIGVLAWTHRWITDDGFIDLRVVRQIVAGHGPVFNVGQRVEAFTSPLWVLVLTVADVVTPIRLEWLAVGLGTLCTVTGFGLAIAGAALLVPYRDDRPALLVPLGALVPLAVLPVWYFATSGLETGLVFGWEGLSLWILARWARGEHRTPGWGAIVLGLGWLIRPELGVFSAVFVVTLLGAQWRRDSWVDRARLIGLMTALPLLYQLFRMGYYASIVPSTALAKEASRSRWPQGWGYLKGFLDPYYLWIPLLVLALGAYLPLVVGLRRRARARPLLVAGAFVLGAILDTAYIVRVGGDYIHARLLLPALFAFCAPVAVVALRREYAASLLVLPWAVVCGLSLRAPGVQLGAFGAGSRTAVTVDALGWGKNGPYRAWYTGPGIYYNVTKLDLAPAPGLHLPTVASWGIGIDSFSIGPRLDVLDLLGLADPFTAHLELVRPGFPIGHEKPLPPPWLAARLTAPGADVRASDFPAPGLIAPMIPPTSGAAFAEQVAWARAALRCPTIRHLVRSYTEPLTIGGFFGNVVDSFHETRLRIPPDPRQAYHEFCGPGSPPGTRPAA